MHSLPQWPDPKYFFKFEIFQKSKGVDWTAQLGRAGRASGLAHCTQDLLKISRNQQKVEVPKDRCRCWDGMESRKLKPAATASVEHTAGNNRDPVSTKVEGEAPHSGWFSNLHTCTVAHTCLNSHV